jgi:hypothetical protein
METIRKQDFTQHFMAHEDFNELSHKFIMHFYPGSLLYFKKANTPAQIYLNRVKRTNSIAKHSFWLPSGISADNIRQVIFAF